MNVVIIKYKGGNIRSVDFALKRLGVDAEITSDPDKIKAADRVIFPGVGEASSTMNYLKVTGLDQLIKELKQPVLGICLGMQLMCRHSEEGDVDCLGIFDVPVKRFDASKAKEQSLKVPHMGWNRILDLKTDLFKEVKEQDYVYFVHSYYVPASEFAAATCHYVQPYSAALHYKNFYATQFHPEKSGDVGEQILKNFINLNY
ncbi:imidazole glycerol phosphate synthase subunit HisH [Prolixibacteraceae bacterium JC049]|nr:imidazole glycerol phosphate synthase subunit HisH [Prolixibacteraceae bacterium JC049]